MHGKVMDWPANNLTMRLHTPVHTPATKWSMTKADDYTTLQPMNEHVLTLEIKQYRGPDYAFWIAVQWDHKLPNNVLQPGVPTPKQMRDLWSDIKAAMGEPMLCPNCEKWTTGAFNSAHSTWECYDCGYEITEQLIYHYAHYADQQQLKPPSGPVSNHAFGKALDINAALANYLPRPVDTYRQKASSEFEGVEALDETLWGSEEGLL